MAGCRRVVSVAGLAVGKPRMLKGPRLLPLSIVAVAILEITSAAILTAGIGQRSRRKEERELALQQAKAREQLLLREIQQVIVEVRHDLPSGLERLRKLATAWPEERGRMEDAFYREAEFLGRGHETLRHGMELANALVEVGLDSPRVRSLADRLDFDYFKGRHRTSILTTVERPVMPAICERGLIYPVRPSQLYASNPEGMEGVWDGLVDAGDPVASDLLLARGRLVFFCSPDVLRSLDETTGEEIWTRRLPSKSQEPVGLAAGEAGLFYLVPTGSLGAVDPADGRILWHQPLARGWPRRLAVTRDSLIVAGEGWLAAFDPKDGKESWSRSFSGKGVGYIAVGEENVAHVMDEKIRFFRLGDGKEVASAKLPGKGSAPAVRWRNRLVAFVESGEVVGFQGVEPRWSVKLEHAVRCPPAVWEGKIFLVTEGGQALCIDASDGTRVWEAEKNFGPEAIGVLLHRNWLVVVCREGGESRMAIHILHPGYREAGGWPQAGGGPSRTFSR